MECVWEPHHSGACHLLRTAERGHQVPPREGAGRGALKLPFSGRGPRGCSSPGSWRRSEPQDSTRALPALLGHSQISGASAPDLSLAGSGSSLLPGYCDHHFHSVDEEIEAHLDSVTQVAPHGLCIRVASLPTSLSHTCSLTPGHPDGSRSQTFLASAVMMSLLVPSPLPAEPTVRADTPRSGRAGRAVLLLAPAPGPRAQLRGFSPGHRVNGVQVGAGPRSPPRTSLPAGSRYFPSYPPTI